MVAMGSRWRCRLGASETRAGRSRSSGWGRCRTPGSATDGQRRWASASEKETHAARARCPPRAVGATVPRSSGCVTTPSAADRPSSRPCKHASDRGASRDWRKTNYCAVCRKSMDVNLDANDNRRESGAHAIFLYWRRDPQFSNCLQRRPVQGKMACLDHIRPPFTLQNFQCSIETIFAF